MYNEKFIFKYKGDLEYIDFDTLYVSQIHFTDFIKILKSELLPDGNLNIKVKALPPGSFPIELMLDVYEGANTIWPFLKNGVEALVYTGGFIGAIESIIKLFKVLKGRKPQGEEKRGDVTIVYIDNTSIEINTLVYEAVKRNPDLRKHLYKTFENINNDDDVTGIEIIDDKSGIRTTINREEFGAFDASSIDNIADSENQETKVTEEFDVQLPIFKVVFEKGFKWQFIYKGHKIYAQINDNDFLQRVISGEERFAGGDILICNMLIHQKLDPIVNVYINDSYVITKVLDHKLRTPFIQPRLDL